MNALDSIPDVPFPQHWAEGEDEIDMTFINLMIAFKLVVKCVVDVLLPLHM